MLPITPQGNKAASTGIEPATLALTARRSAIELRGNETPQIGIEPMTFCASNRRYYHLSYRGNLGGEMGITAVDWFNLTRRISHSTIPPM